MNPKQEKIQANFDDKQYKKMVNQILNNCLPNEIQPEIQIQRVEVEKPVVQVIKEKETREVQVYDNLREAHEQLLGFSRPMNVNKALEIYKQEAKKNNISAINCLGQINLEGINQKQDFKQAFDYYLQSASTDNSEGWFQLGRMFQNGFLTPQQKQQFFYKFQNFGSQNKTDLSVAFYCYQQAGNEHAGALTYIGSIYEENHIDDGIIQNYKEAKLSYERAARMNYPLAQNNLGKLQIQFDKKQTNFFNSKDLEVALKNFQLAYDQQLPQAALNLGICYERGYGIKVDLQKAIELFEKL